MAEALSLMHHQQGPRRRLRRVIAQRDGLSDQGGVDLVEVAVQAYGSIFVHAPLCFEQKQVIEIELRRHPAHVGGALRPFVQGRQGVDAAVWTSMILAFDPAPQLAVERIEFQGRFKPIDEAVPRTSEKSFYVKFIVM